MGSNHGTKGSACIVSSLDILRLGMLSVVSEDISRGNLLPGGRGVYLLIKLISYSRSSVIHGKQKGSLDG